MSQDNSPEKGTSEATTWGAKTEVVKGLRHKPALLFGFGLAIILLATGALAFENLRLIAISWLSFVS